MAGFPFLVLEHVRRAGRSLAGRVVAMARTEADAKAWARGRTGAVVARAPSSGRVKLGAEVRAVVDEPRRVMSSKASSKARKNPPKRAKRPRRNPDSPDTLAAMKKFRTAAAKVEKMIAAEARGELGRDGWRQCADAIDRLWTRANKPEIRGHEAARIEAHATCERLHRERVAASEAGIAARRAANTAEIARLDAKIRAGRDPYLEELALHGSGSGPWRRNPSKPRKGCKATRKNPTPPPAELARRFERLAEPADSPARNVRVVRIRPQNKQAVPPGLYAAIVIGGRVDRWHGPYASEAEMRRGMVRIDEVARALEASGASAAPKQARPSRVPSSPKPPKRAKAAKRPKAPKVKQPRLARAAYREAGATRAMLDPSERYAFDQTWRGLWQKKGRATLAEAWGEWIESHPADFADLQLESAGAAEKKLLREMDREYARQEREAHRSGGGGDASFDVSAFAA